jgi:hypothetical protein
MMLGRILCALGVHKKPPGYRSDSSGKVHEVCQRCGHERIYDAAENGMVKMSRPKEQ